MNEKTQEIRKILGIADDVDLARVTITPNMAKQLLNYNNNNRELRENTVKRYAKDMSEGRFLNQSSTIGFYEGKLTNGQHRLSACVKANVEFNTIVDLLFEQNLHIDRQLSRRCTDNALINHSLDGYIPEDYIKDAMTISACYLRLQSNNKMGDPYLQVQFARKYSKQITQLIDSGVIAVRGKQKPLFKSDISAALLIAYINGVDEHTLLHIREVLNTGNKIDESKDYLITNYRDFLITNHGSKHMTTNERRSLFNGITYIAYRYDNDLFGKNHKKRPDTSKAMYTVDCDEQSLK